MAYILFTLYNNGVPCIYNVPNNLWELCDVQFFISKGCQLGGLIRKSFKETLHY